MGFRFRKSIKLPLGFRINLSKSGIGYSYGFKGYRHTAMANGRTRDTVSIPGTGISYVNESKTGKNKKGNNMTSENNTQKTASEYNKYSCITPHMKETKEQLTNMLNDIQVKKSILGNKDTLSVIANFPIWWFISIIIFGILLENIPKSLEIIVALITFIFHEYLLVITIKEVIYIYKNKEISKQIDEQLKIFACGRLYRHVVHAQTKEQFEYFNVKKYITQNSDIQRVASDLSNEEYKHTNKIYTFVAFVEYIIKSNQVLRKRDFHKLEEYILNDENYITEPLCEICIEYNDGQYRRTAGLYSISDMNSIRENEKRIAYEKEEQKRQEELRKQEEQRQQEEFKRHEEERKQAERDAKRNNRMEKELNNALAMFMLDMPFSMEELKRQRNRLIKTFHSDNNSNDDVTKYAVKINNAYELLRKYATD